MVSHISFSGNSEQRATCSALAVLSGVTQQLWEDPSRRFVWSEMSFFMRWWETQAEETKSRFRTLVQRGQLEFVGAGWVQHDEANPSYDSSELIEATVCCFLIYPVPSPQSLRK